MLDALRDRELVLRTVDPSDARRRHLSLSPSGQALMQTLTISATTGRNEFLATLSLGERQQLNVLLQRLYDAHTG